MNDIQTLAQAVISNPSIFSDEVIEAAHRAISSAHTAAGGTYKPWEPETASTFFIVNSNGEIEEGPFCKGGISEKRTAFFNRFRTERFAKLAASTDKINHCVWQWKEKNDPRVPQHGDEFYNAQWGWSCGRLEWTVGAGGDKFGPFTSREKARQFILDCRPYLDEYAKAMGWKGDAE